MTALVPTVTTDIIMRSNISSNNHELNNNKTFTVNNNTLHYVKTLPKVSFFFLQITSQKCCKVGGYYYIYFTDEETKAHQGQVTWQKFIQVIESGKQPCSHHWVLGSFLLLTPFRPYM